jgi:hypothetical protein
VNNFQTYLNLPNYGNQNMTEHVPAILITTISALFLYGVGTMITQDENRALLFKQQCIESGMQYIEGSCIK